MADGDVDAVNHGLVGSFGNTAVISPCLPLSLPASTTTLSPFLSFAAITAPPAQRDDLHEVLGAQFANHRPEDTRAHRFTLVVQDDGGVAVKTDRGAVPRFTSFAVRTTTALRTSPFFTRRAGWLHRRTDDDVAHRRIATVRTTQDLDALHPASAGVVSDIQIGLHLDHLVSPRPLGTGITRPQGFGLSLDQTDASVRTVQRLVFEIGAHSMMRTVSPTLNWLSASWARYFFGRTHGLVQQRMLEATLDQNGDGLFVLVADDLALQDAFGHGPGSLVRRRGGCLLLVQNGFTRATSRRTERMRAVDSSWPVACWEAQVERFLLQRQQLFFQLIGRLVFQFLRFHAPVPFNITGEPLHRRTTLIPVGFMMKACPYSHCPGLQAFPAIRLKSPMSGPLCRRRLAVTNAIATGARPTAPAPKCHAAATNARPSVCHQSRVHYCGAIIVIIQGYDMEPASLLASAA